MDSLMSNRHMRGRGSRGALAVLATVLGTVAALFVPGFVAAQQASDFRVVVHPENPLTALTGDQLSQLFLRRTTTWPHGQPAQPVDQAAKSAVRQVFSATVMERPVRAIQAHWQQQIFSGRGVPPLELASDGAVVEYVRENAGAVGYVTPGTDLTGLKVLEVTR